VKDGAMLIAETSYINIGATCIKCEFGSSLKDASFATKLTLHLKPESWRL
jgi:hypothetical protein